ncbi:FecR family protein [Butyricimonas sp.]|uniref:FecR family protein n=1 Tax=Butyricimonas TaxID=574697 RepID=UPI001B2B1F48|nr:FecR family protein [Butyricimonas sp.]MBO4960523.1 FecR domain-containing protein [Butyricimonas sp.]MDY5488047.1 FecR domain-containing protein [Butyricimonas virosa]
MKENEIDRILADIIAGEKISEEDQRLLEEWRQHSEESLYFEKEVRELARAGSELKSRRTNASIFERVEQDVKKQRKIRFMQRVSVAASIVLLVGFSFYFMFLPGKQENEFQQMAATTIVHGGARAELILPRGEVIPLDTMTRVVLAGDSLLQVTSSRNTLIYNSETNNEQVEYHTIRVPRGGEYNLLLSDNTKVYLNAGSSLRYPVRFSGDRREVILEGEGYFEVTRDTAKPFVVKTGSVNVQVLGTAFNVNAYPEEENVETTLVEGKVRVDGKNEQRILEPGTQLVYDKRRENMVVLKVDTEEYISWKDGYYYFKRETLGRIMDRLSRWYNLNVFYQNEELKSIEFGGRLKRYEDITYLLERMEETQDIKFIIKGNTITVQRKTD